MLAVLRNNRGILSIMNVIFSSAYRRTLETRVLVVGKDYNLTHQSVFVIVWLHPIILLRCFCLLGKLLTDFN